MLETAQRNELRTLVETIKDILDEDYRKQLLNLGIQPDSPELIPLTELLEFELLDDKLAQAEFQTFRDQIHSTILQEAEAIGEEWNEGYFWYVDKCVYSFFNRIFAIRIMEELDLLQESTLVPQEDLGNRSARMAKIQENHPQNRDQWWELLLHDVFSELDEEIKVIFDPNDPALHIFPDETVILKVIHHLNDLNPDIYQAEDCIGWFYHYYVVKFRKTHKTMGSHGSKSPKHPYYLSILNTVYTPRWMVRILVDNSLGHWWHNHNPDSELFYKSPYFIQKQPNDLRLTTDKLVDLRILDPACGSGNFLVYAFSQLVLIYQEKYPKMLISEIVDVILRQNLFGIDINRRPAQLSVLALYILAKRTIKEKSASQLEYFKMPTVNIICCDIRLPENEYKEKYLKNVNPKHKEVLEQIFNLFDNADQLGSLIDVSSLQEKLNSLPSETQTRLDQFYEGKKLLSIRNVIKIIEGVMKTNKQNVGMQMFGEETQHALNLIQVLLQKYDVVISNPPFGLPIKKTKKQLKALYPYSYSDLVATFVDQGLRLLKNNGYLSYVSDFSFLHLTKFEKFRKKILLNESALIYFLMIGNGALPNAGNRPILFLLKKKVKNNLFGYYRIPNYKLNKTFENRYYSDEIIKDIKALNSNEKLPSHWNKINQERFRSLPRVVIDFSLDKKYDELLNFFKIYPRLDISQHSRVEKEDLTSKEKIARAFQGLATGNNDQFIKYFFEIPSTFIRSYDPIKDVEELKQFDEKPFVPYSKGYGDIRYYVNNGYILWWNKKAIKKMMETPKSVRLQNIKLQGKSNIKWSLVSSKRRGRFTLSNPGVVSDIVSMNILIKESKLSDFTLLGYLNSRIIVFIVRLQTKDRKWQAGNIARIPIPIEFLVENKKIGDISEESYKLRRDWDTNYPMSPIFSETLLDKIITPNQTINEKYTPKTNHPFQYHYMKCNSKISEKIEKISIKPINITFKKLLKKAKNRFNLLTRRLNEIDCNINKILYNLLNETTQNALDKYYDRFVGKMIYEPEPEIWLKDFLMANLMDLIRNSPNGIITFYNQIEAQAGLYPRFIDNLCKKFDRDEAGLQPLLEELEQKEYLGKSLKEWIVNDFFLYHCSRFGGRPIMWQFTSKQNNKGNGALNIFVDYHQVTENTLPTIRVDLLQPLLRRLEDQRDAGILPENEHYKCDEISQFLTAFRVLEKGYPEIPNPNALTGKNAARGRGDDKTWGWVFGEAAKRIQNGYQPDRFMGVLVNLIPLSLNLPDKNKDKFDIQYRSITPKGTINAILKKLSALDQLKQTSA